MTNIKSKDLTLLDLRQHAVWTWSTNLMHSEDSLIPVAMTLEGLADPDTLLIHAKFVTANGAQHEGLVVYDPDFDEVFAIELFLENSRITLNRKAPELSRRELERYAALTGESDLGVLPIRYQVIPSELSISPAEFTLKL